MIINPGPLIKGLSGVKGGTQFFQILNIVSKWFTSWIRCWALLQFELNLWIFVFNLYFWFLFQRALKNTSASTGTLPRSWLWKIQLQGDRGNFVLSSLIHFRKLNSTDSFQKTHICRTDVVWKESESFFSSKNYIIIILPVRLVRFYVASQTTNSLN